MGHSVKTKCQKAIAGHKWFTKLSNQADFLSLRKLDGDSFSEDKAAAKERRLKICNLMDSKALIVFPLSNLLFNIVYWAYFLS